MFKMNEQTKQKILEAIFVIEDDNYPKDRYEEITIKFRITNVLKRVKYLFGN